MDFPPTQISQAKFWHGTGCEACGDRGYQGRTGIYELLISSEDLQELVIKKAAASVIGTQARADGMVSLRE